jgi:hypothetical protein
MQHMQENQQILALHRWLKQVASNKTTEEFCVYYGDLLADQRKVSEFVAVYTCYIHKLTMNCRNTIPRQPN